MNSRQRRPLLPFVASDDPPTARNTRNTTIGLFAAILCGLDAAMLQPAFAPFGGDRRSPQHLDRVHHRGRPEILDEHVAVSLDPRLARTELNGHHAYGSLVYRCEPTRLWMTVLP